MNEDGMPFLRNAARRRWVVLLTSGVSLVFTFGGLCLMLVGFRPKGFDAAFGLPRAIVDAFAFAVCGLIGGLTAKIIGTVAERFHRSFWPEQPNDE